MTDEAENTTAAAPKSTAQDDARLQREFGQAAHQATVQKLGELQLDVIKLNAAIVVANADSAHWREKCEATEKALALAIEQHNATA